ncbi:variant surface glycoprotein (VSG, atypical), putative [Trypanosoma brucei brucei TREU927]|uniref:Variant surface glycoprotein (VSG, atypical), putative n=1 Tax=Trypanosoma brucei brucei (strain 927/4 GUTat10.1) TaxID=185431 RepID=Q580P7_TRYB2|nr:variant surface glycoprotein (VSG, atypical), putative [Trypanosoma brucei brucei TREU927]AAX79137.1 variant surface glycoprotein (VSG, atypical), putative [Trypanosoma brucei]AAZ11127.1 variant surface glycoprotein (VSG, atypical), putative [Trypanosoma brucei brucei TREU927]
MESRSDTKGTSHIAVAAAVPVLFMTLMRCGMAQTITEPSSDKVTNLCTEAKYTAHLADHIVAAAEEPEREISDMQIYAEAWNLLAASTNQTDKRAATYALAAYMSAAAAKAKQLQNGKYKAAVLAATYLQRRSALTRTLQAMRVKGKTAVGQFTKKQGEEASCSHKETPTLSDEGDCGRQDNAINHPESIAIDLRTATHIKLVHGSKLRPLELTHEADVRETTPSEQAQVKATGCKAVLRSDFYVTFIASTTKKEDKTGVTAIKIFAGDDANTSCAELKDATKKSEKDNDLLINKICTYITKPDPQIITISSLTPAMLANTTAVQVAFRSFVHAATGKAPSDAEIEMQLQKLYGGDKQHFKRDFVTILTTKNMTYHTGSGFVTETFLDAAKNNHAHKVLIYLKGQRAAAQAKQPRTNESEINGPVCGGEGQEECKLDEKKDPEKPNGTQMRKWPKALQWMITRQGGNCKTIQQEDCKEDCTWDEGACDGAVGISASMNISLFMAFLLLA